VRNPPPVLSSGFFLPPLLGFLLWHLPSTPAVFLLSFFHTSQLRPFLRSRRHHRRLSPILRCPHLTSSEPPATKPFRTPNPNLDLWAPSPPSAAAASRATCHHPHHPNFATTSLLCHRLAVSFPPPPSLLRRVSFESELASIKSPTNPSRKGVARSVADNSAHLGQIPYKSKSEARDHTVEFRLLKTGVPKFPSLFYIWSDLFDSFSRDNSALTWCNVMQWRHALIYLYVAMELTSDAEHLTLSTSISKFWKIPK
jgi:hypothetical protein